MMKVNVQSRVFGMDVESFLDGRVIRIPVETFEDGRGLLTAIEFSDYRFHSVRAFLVTAPSDSVRGGHGHATGRQILMQISGTIDVEVVHGNHTARITLDDERRAILIEPPSWSRQIYRGANPAMMVFCDTPYDPADYVAGGADCV
jgi:dTDP-4-dehydrorhamnose 3,5-epimerase-like enzyme